MGTVHGSEGPAGVTVDAAFSAALEQDAGVTDTSPAQIEAPPRKPAVIDPDAPHGRAEDGTPYAPFGIGQNGKPRQKPAGPGRKPKDPDSRPRVAKALPSGETPKAAPKTGDYSGQIGDFLDGLWMLGSAFPLSWVPAIEARVNAQAYILKQNKPQLVKGWATAAANHEGVAAVTEKLTTGSASWVLPVMFAVTPFVAQSALMWRAPVAGDVQVVADYNKAQWEEFVKASQEAMAAEDGEETGGTP